MTAPTWLRQLGPLAIVALAACQPMDSPDGGASASSATATATDIGPPPGAEWEGDAFTFNQIRDDIYHAVGTGNLTVGCNASIIINDEDVLVVDSHMTPAAGYALREELKKITDKPIRYVINSHFHFDHSHGNQIYGDDVEIIGHHYTRHKLASGASKQGRAWEGFVETLPDQIKATEAALKTATDAGNSDEVEELTRRLTIQKRYKESTDSIVATPPTVAFAERMTITRGGRDIQLLFFGRGHTGGDVVTYVPDAKVVATGDLMTAGIAYMGDAYMNEWADTLDYVKALDFDVVLPGHGEAFEDIERIGHFQAYLRDLYPKIVTKHEAGASAAEAAETIDMTSHAEHFPSIDGPGVNAHAVERVYALLNGDEN